jgi:acetyl esterase/lipase
LRYPHRVLFYLHGGGYAAGSIYSHLGLMSRLANDLGMRVLAINYRLAPEAPYPAGLEDAAKAYRWLLEHEHYRPEEIILMGDSAGGGLASATLLYLKELSLPQPLCSIVLSPWADLSLSGESLSTLAHRDPILPADKTREWAAWYVGQNDAKHPLISPIYGNWEGVCPLYIQVGSEEILLSDAERLAAKAQQDGVAVKYECWQGMPHVWHMGWHYLPEARKAIRQIAHFVDDQITRHEKQQLSLQPQAPAKPESPRLSFKLKTLTFTRDSLAALTLGGTILKNWLK